MAAGWGRETVDQLRRDLEDVGDPVTHTGARQSFRSLIHSGVFEFPSTSWLGDSHGQPRRASAGAWRRVTPRQQGGCLPAPAALSEPHFKRPEWCVALMLFIEKHILFIRQRSETERGIIATLYYKALLLSALDKVPWEI